jgi:hypothetical protein
LIRGSIPYDNEFGKDYGADLTTPNELGCVLLALALLMGLSSRTAPIDPRWAARVLVLALFFVVLNPEVRVLVGFMQFIGIDVVLMLFVLQFRYYLSAIRPFAVGSFTRLLSLQVRPGIAIAPSLSIIRMSPALALYALLLPVATVGIRTWGIGRVLLSRITNIDGI